MREHARPATSSDVAVVAALGLELRAELAPLRGGRRAIASAPWSEPLEPHVTTALAAGDELVAVGCLDDVVVGYGAVRQRAGHDGACVAELHELYVTEAARGIGVGEAVLEVVLDWASGRGCVGVDAVALPGMRETKNFFETFGMVARAIVVHRSLEPDGGDERR